MFTQSKKVPVLPCRVSWWAQSKALHKSKGIETHRGQWEQACPHSAPNPPCLCSHPATPVLWPDDCANAFLTDGSPPTTNTPFLVSTLSVLKAQLSPQREQELVYLGTNMSDHNPESSFRVRLPPNSIFWHGNSFMKIFTVME